MRQHGWANSPLRKPRRYLQGARTLSAVLHILRPDHGLAMRVQMLQLLVLMTFMDVTSHPMAKRALTVTTAAPQTTESPFTFMDQGTAHYYPIVREVRRN